MNKQELIKHIKDLPYSEGLIVDTIKISRNGLLKLIEQLDEPEKVTVPQYIADRIEYCKESDGYSLFHAMDYCFNFKKCASWLDSYNNQETFARAWLDGYEVEEEKRYWVKLKAVDQYLVSVKDENFLGFLSSKLRTYFTRKEIEDAGFGEVFNSPLFEVEEVE